MKMSIESLSKLLPFIGLVISTLTYFSGNNILDQFRSSELSYSIQRSDLGAYSYSANPFVGSQVDTPYFDTYAEFTVQNSGGKPSKDLRVAIKLNGEIFAFDATSEEVIDKKTLKGSEIQIELKRLANSASVRISAFYKRRTDQYSVRVVDDFGSKDVAQIGNQSSLSWIQSIGLLIGVISLLGIAYTTVPSKTKRTLVENQVTIDRLQTDVANAEGKIEDLQTRVEELESTPRQSAKEYILELLKERET